MEKVNQTLSLISKRLLFLSLTRIKEYIENSLLSNDCRYVLNSFFIHLYILLGQEY